MSTNTTVYTGFWTNWSKGAVTGSTLTLSNRNGAVLIAALAIFLQFAGIGSWSIMCFVAHQMRTTTEARDGLHHQQQAVLRNATSDFGTLWQFTRIGWAWRSRSSSFRRSLTPVLIGALHVIAFGAASILSSHITTVGDQVLVAQSPLCGDWKVATAGTTLNSTTGREETAYDSYLRMTMAASQEYVQTCLSGSELPECNTFKQRQLYWTSANISCPFDNLCLGAENGSFYMDTGVLDSRDDFGINGRDKERIQFRKNTTCVPIKSDGYMVEGNSSIDFDGYFSSGSSGTAAFNYTAAFYGPMNPEQFADSGIEDSSISNATYIYTNFREMATPMWNNGKSPYDVHVETSIQGFFTPLPEFKSSNQTLSLIFASIGGFYQEVSDDLWLSAHKNYTIQDDEASGGSYEEEIFYPDRKLSALACVEQVQICNPSPQFNNRSRCTPWLPSDVLESSKEILAEVLDTERQKALAYTMRVASETSMIFYVIDSLSSPLLADELAYAGQLLPPAPNQWVLEASNWFTISLANTQRFFNEYVTGPPQEFAQYKDQDTARNYPSIGWVCQNLIIRRNDFTNFSTLAISLVFGLGLLVMATSMCLETLVGLFRIRLKKSKWKQRAWWAEGTLQLQRRAFEALGVRDWESGDWDSIPLSDRGHTWNAFQYWDEIRPLVKTPEKSPGELESQASPSVHDGSQQTHSMVMKLPLVAEKEMKKDVQRIRSKSF
ncbi:uncharacterized protein LY89DRAFT_747572 [Mollisia scopiformis]|uniref:Uncharacterized protein n=1 Tax=Mollisia scopiformis TaxID=149040 RepID=A0A194XC55_MOLSC|nr:uncharacterized protein LY89DRAFT_747572 [Mollisia scopiformis]KUJ17744.1 hypothetical protein LY89DRAFT_747572 [Mollisia scopiformis]